LDLVGYSRTATSMFALLVALLCSALVPTTVGV
jgi:hypothetical protein